MIRAAMVASLAALVVSGCVTRPTYEAEVARSRGYEHLLGECRALVEAMGTTREKLKSEQKSLVDEKLELIRTLESLRAGNEEIGTQLERERELRMAREAELAEVSNTYKGLVADLENEVKSGEIEIENLKGRLQVRALDQILFDSGSVEIKPRGREVLDKVAAQIAKATDEFSVRVEGHTDNVPVRTERFPTNWELSAARATAVVRRLVDQGVGVHAVGATGFGEFRPIADNDTPAGRSRNRRIEIVLVPKPRE